MAPPERIAEFEQIFRDHVGQVCRALKTMGVAPRQVDDAAQEVFLIVHDKLAEFEGRSKLSTWIYAITYRVGANYRAKARRQPRLASLEDNQLASAGSPEQALSGKEAARFVEHFCSQLEDDLRDIFVLCLLEGQSSVDVGALLGINVNTVYSKVRLLREEFRSALERHHRWEVAR
jgi:RNA polymerase sigma-70 factor (ECF subfamily)